MSDTTSEFSAESSSSVSNSSPTRRRPPPLRLSEVGLDPSSIIGKKLRRISRSETHPCLTLQFADNTTFQIKVDGYDPIHKGVPKSLEMDPVLNELLSGSPISHVDVEVIDCALISLSDKAFQRAADDRTIPDLQQWDQRHLGVAFKFADVGESRWHCVWATMEEYDEGACVFRSYDDVYLDRLQRSPRKSKTHARKHSSAGFR